MYVTKISIDNLTIPNAESVEIEYPSIMQICEAINQLNGGTRTQVVLEGQENSIMIIGGGNENRYIAEVVINVDEEFYNLVNPNRQDDQTELQVVSGGQEGLFKAKHVVELKHICEAAKKFAETGELYDQLVWEKN